MENRGGKESNNDNNADDGVDNSNDDDDHTTAAAMRTPEKGPRKAPKVAAITKTYLAMIMIVINMIIIICPNVS